jgi:hypothetical protein
LHKGLRISDTALIQELTNFINHRNEIKAANVATKEDPDVNIIKPDGDQSKSKK